jgi:hypothetical protein
VAEEAAPSAWVQGSTVNVAWNDETFVDALGHRRAPGSVTLERNASSGLPNLSVTVKVIALARPEMTYDQLEEVLTTRLRQMC